MTIGERIKATRKKTGLTQKALGEKCNMPDSQIRQYELGMVNPKLETLRRIAAALGVYVGDLVDDWSVFSKKELCDDWESGIEITLLQKYKQLNSIGQDKALEHIELLNKIPEYRRKPDDSPEE